MNRGFALLCLILATPRVRGLTLTSLPTGLSIEHVSQSYPSSLLRTLFSSVPRREYAVRNITLHVDSDILVLLGASSSGKSTILRMVAGMESPVSGRVTWEPPAVRPVYLDRKPGKDSTRTVQSILNSLSTAESNDSWEQVIEHIRETVGFGVRELKLTPSELSPSDSYRFGLICATLESIVPALSNLENGIPSPILLLDEWMDLETSSIVHRVEESICNLTIQGAVVLCATHKPQLFRKAHRSITLCRGEILLEQSTL
jgi:ABC-type polysaccharide/polyol phosphate transport system ATPase subunit